MSVFSGPVWTFVDILFATNFFNLDQGMTGIMIRGVSHAHEQESASNLLYSLITWKTKKFM